MLHLMTVGFQNYKSGARLKVSFKLSEIRCCELALAENTLVIEFNKTPSHD